jgi:predicted dehydrogenase
MKSIRWGILGPGKIAQKFASAFEFVPEAQLIAIASRDENRATAFADTFHVPKIYSDYEQLVADKEIDVIYVATPHPFHYRQTLLCLHHNKAVLCEKPMTMNLRQADELIRVARANNTFLMEGMWSRFFPATLKVIDLLREDAIGEIKFLRADFGFAAPFNPEGRVFNLALGGGAQLDVGVYPMFLALLLLGKPEKIQALVQLATTGVDQSTSVQFSFQHGAVAQIFSSVIADSPKQADIVGTLGTITMHSPWHKSQAITLRKNSAEVSTFEMPFPGIGFQFQLRHVTECLQKGLKESPMMPYSLSLWMAETADEILRQGGVVYPDLA